MSSARLLLDLLLRGREFGGTSDGSLARNEPTGLFEQAIHLFERDALGLRQKSPEENSIGDVADDKEEEIPPTLR
jgi:hypothetical protein